MLMDSGCYFVSFTPHHCYFVAVSTLVIQPPMTITNHSFGCSCVLRVPFQDANPSRPGSGWSDSTSMFWECVSGFGGYYTTIPFTLPTPRIHLYNTSLHFPTSPSLLFWVGWTANGRSSPHPPGPSSWLAASVESVNKQVLVRTYG